MTPQDYKKISDEVDGTLAEIVQEYTDALSLIRNDRRVVRVRLLMAFSMMEVFCNIFNTYFNLGLGNRELMKRWIRDFCFAEVNESFKTHPYFHMLTDEHLYKFRNSIVHAFAIPEAENGVSILVPNGNESAEVIKNLDEGFKRLGHTVAFISPDGLTRVILDAYRIMHHAIFLNPNTVTQSDYDAIKRVADDFTRRGAKGIDLTKTSEILQTPLN